MKNVNGFLHSIESSGTLDGPGVRRVLFLSGCPLNCLYCHNPDTRAMRAGQKTDSFTLLKDIAANSDLLKKMHGGVTLSGGEPLCQPAFVKSILEGCKMMDLHTALDTSGYLGAKADDDLLSYTDLVLLDIKSFNPKNYQTLTGKALQPTLDFAQRLADLNKKVWLRYVLVPGYTDQMSDLAELATFAKKLGNVERVEVLPFHKMGEFKWQQLGMDFPLKDTPEPDQSLISQAVSTFADAGLEVY